MGIANKKIFPNKKVRVCFEMALFLCSAVMILIGLNSGGTLKIYRMFLGIILFMCWLLSINSIQNFKLSRLIFCQVPVLLIDVIISSMVYCYFKFEKQNMGFDLLVIIGVICVFFSLLYYTYDLKNTVQDILSGFMGIKKKEKIVKVLSSIIALLVIAMTIGLFGFSIYFVNNISVFY